MSRFPRSETMFLAQSMSSAREVEFAPFYTFCDGSLFLKFYSETTYSDNLDPFRCHELAIFTPIHEAGKPKL